MPPQHTAVPERQTFVPPTHREILTILGGLMLGMFLAALDQTIVATSIRTIGDDLHGLSLQAWVTTAYLLTATISTPLYGKLSDIYGRKPLYLISISIFVVGSLLAGTADSMYQLAVYRGVQNVAVSRYAVVTHARSDRPCRSSPMVRMDVAPIVWSSAARNMPIIRPPAPMPWIARKAASWYIESARPQSIEPTTKTPIANR